MNMDWLTVRHFGRVKYFHLSYAVIIGLPLLAQFYEVVMRTLLKTPFNISLTFPFTFKLLYFSSFCYALGIALYQYFCPTIIKNFETELAYADASQPVYERAHPDRKYQIVLAHLKETQADIKNNLIVLKQELDNHLRDPMAKAHDRKAVQDNLSALIDSVYPSCLQTFLMKEFSRARRKYLPAIYASAFFFTAGTLLLMFLLIRKTWQLFFV